ncbi:MAG TPA: flagellar biosynthetic protein FliR [Burkholderiaceae bacterium]|nr:flagellar biosynthetic protein FliR [Burkholderiaceae bacterium]
MIAFTTAQLSQWYGSLFWPLTRVLALLAIAPVLSHQAIPIRAKVGIALAIALAIAPVVGAPPLTGVLEAHGFVSLARNILVGLALGFAVRLVFVGIELAGQMIGLQIGLGFAAFFNPDSGQSENVVSSFLAMLTLLMFLAVDGHLILLSALVESFRVFPVEAAGGSPIDALAMVRAAGDVFAIALTICLPILAVMLLVNVVLGVMARIAPQLNLFAVGFPVTVLAGLAALVLFLPTLEAPMRAVLMKGLAALPGSG